MRKSFYSLLFTFFFLLLTSTAFAQFEVPEFEKVTTDRQGWFMDKFADIKWTGRGLYENTAIDDINTGKIRARLKAAFGEPTKSLEDLIDNSDFRPAQAIQFEYWFVVNDSIPLLILDVDGPFSNGLVYGGASKYIDLMPQIKRAFSNKLMSVDSLSSYQDYYYSPEREQWFNVTYINDQLKTEKIEAPEGMEIDF